MRKYTFIAISLFCAVSFYSCKENKPQTRQDAIQEFRNGLTAEDSTTMLKLCNDCMELLKEGNIDEAINSMYVYDDSTASVSPVSEQLRNNLRHNFEVFPVLDYELEYFSFQLEGINDVKYKIQFAEGGSEETGQFYTGFMFNPVKVDGQWFLSVKRSDQKFDETVN